MFCYVVKAKTIPELYETVFRVFDNYDSSKILFDKIVGYIYAELYESYYDTMSKLSIDEMYSNFESEDFYWEFHQGPKHIEKLIQ